MEVKHLITGPIEVNTYIVTNGTNECIVIDPADAKKVLEHCSGAGLTPAYVLLTHGHFDHILGVAELQERGAKVYIHKDDAECLYSNHKNLAVMGGMSVPPCHADVELSGGETITLLDMDIEVISTPGHTPGGVCYVFKRERVIFSGDTLFRLSVGRCDLPGSDPRAMYDAIALELFTLNGDYQVYPGHMSETTLDYERRHNPFMQRWSPDIW